MKKIMYVMLVLLVLLSTVWLYVTFHGFLKPHGQRVVDGVLVFRDFLYQHSLLKHPSRKVTEKMLDAWARGETGAEYWSFTIDNKPLMSLYNVKEYKFLGEKMRAGDTIVLRYRIKSTVKAGFPIENMWDFIVRKRHGKWKVDFLMEAYP